MGFPDLYPWPTEEERKIMIPNPNAYDGWSFPRGYRGKFDLPSKIALGMAIIFWIGVIGVIIFLSHK